MYDLIDLVIAFTAGAGFMFIAGVFWIIEGFKYGEGS